MPKIGKKDRTLTVVSGEGYCRKCKEVIALSNFYPTTNPFLDSNGFLSICKKCCGGIYEHYFKIYNNLEKALYFTCRDLNICFNEEALKQTQSHIEKLLSTGKRADAVLGYYKSKLGSLGKRNDNIDDFRFDENGNISESINIRNSKSIEDDEFEITEDMHNRWGDNLPIDDYKFLEYNYHNLTTSFECNTYTQVILFEEIANQRLILKKKKEKGDAVDRELKTLQDLLGSSGIKPVQETGSNAAEQSVYGVLLKKWENERPLPEPSEEWKDVDGIMKYITIWFLGHLCRMMGIDNTYSKMYDEEISKHTVEIIDESNDIENSNVDIQVGEDE